VLARRQIHNEPSLGGTELDNLDGALARLFVIATVPNNAGFGIPAKLRCVNAVQIVEIVHLIVPPVLVS
jgi:hypothetical protein